MVYIDLPADLNMEDDQQRNIARLTDAIDPEAIRPGVCRRRWQPGRVVVGHRRGNRGRLRLLPASQGTLSQ
jgi:hypothetical protein